MEPTIRHHRELHTDTLFLMEQWTALLIGIACLAVFLWTAFDRYEAFSTWHFPHFSTATVVSIGWLLTIAVGLIGVALVRFAFYQHNQPEPDALSQGDSAQMSSSTPTAKLFRFTTPAASRRRP